MVHDLLPSCPPASREPYRALFDELSGARISGAGGAPSDIVSEADFIPDEANASTSEAFAAFAVEVVVRGKG